MLKRKFLTLACLLTIVATSCQQNDPIPTITAPNPPMTGAIQANNASSLAETVSLSIGIADPVTAIAFTPDDSQLNIVTAPGAGFQQWDITSQKLVRTITLPSVGLGAAAFDASGNHLLLSGVSSESYLGTQYLNGHTPKQLFGPQDGIYLYDVQTGKLINQYPLSNSGKNYHGAVLSLDGHFAATRQTEASNGSLLSDTKPEILVFSLQPTASPTFDVVFSTNQTLAKSITDFALDAEGRLLAVNIGNGQIELWDLSNSKYWGTLFLDPNNSTSDDFHVTQLVISPTREWAAAFSVKLANTQTSQVTLWNLGTHQIQWQTDVQSGTAPINCLTFNPASNILAGAAGDGLHIWNVIDGKSLKTLPGPEAFSITFNRAGTALAWGDWSSGKIHIAQIPGQ